MKSIGLSYMAYWGDQFEDIASGDVFFLPDLILGLDKAGYKVYALQEDLDKQQPRFENFLVEDRTKAYNLINFTKELPDLDIVVVEWRWKMDGRNWNGEDGRDSVPMDDYYRQMEILEYYHNHTNTQVFIIDSDHKLSEDDERKWFKARILTFAQFPKEIIKKRQYVYWPFDSKRLTDREKYVHAPFSYRQENTYCTDPNFILSYIGNNYERDNEFNYWIGGIEHLLNSRIHLYGNWAKYPNKLLTLQESHSSIVFHPKITKADMTYIYSRSLAVPLLAKDDYNTYGHMTHRLEEVMYSGSLPIGFAHFKGIEKFVIPELIAKDDTHFFGILEKLAGQTYEERLELWKKQINHFQYGPDDFIKVLES
jgi:hypothetical protein